MIGSYGYARSVLGSNYLGFILGSCNFIEYIFYVSSSVISLGQMVSAVIPAATGYEPVTWVVFFLISVFIHMFGGTYFWKLNMVLALGSIIVLLIYCFGSLSYVNFTSNVTAPEDSRELNSWFEGGVEGFLTNLPLAAWLYIGVETLIESSRDAKEPCKDVPRGQMACIGTLLATSIMVVFISCSLPPGVFSLATNPFPLNGGIALQSLLSFIHFHW